MKYILLALLLSGCGMTRHSWKGKISPIAGYITHQLDTGNKVKIAVFHNPQIGCYDTEATQRSFENGLLDGFNTYEKFALVDRGNIEKILSEQQFSLTGAVEQNDVIRLGNISGLTHILFWDCSNGFSSGWLNSKLVNVETGSILASQSVSW